MPVLYRMERVGVCHRHQRASRHLRHAWSADIAEAEREVYDDSRATNSTSGAPRQLSDILFKRARPCRRRARPRRATAPTSAPSRRCARSPHHRPDLRVAGSSRSSSRPTSMPCPRTVGRRRPHPHRLPADRRRHRPPEQHQPQPPEHPRPHGHRPRHPSRVRRLPLPEACVRGRRLLPDRTPRARPYHRRQGPHRRLPRRPGHPPRDGRDGLRRRSRRTSRARCATPPRW